MNPLLNRYVKNAEFVQPFSTFMMFVVKNIQSKSMLAPDLYDFLSGMLRDIQKSALDQGYPDSAIKAGLLAVCAWADEEIMNAQWDGVSEIWPNTLLQKEFFNTNLGGELFYQKLNTLFGDTIIAQDIFALCLAQGFKGKYVLNLDIKELELKKSEAIQKSLAYSGLNNPDSDTFADLAYFMHDRKPPSIQSSEATTIAFTVTLVIAITLICYLFLLNQASIVMRVIG
jgi:type IV/VI secretion system ImpK/VasF family protein